MPSKIKILLCDDHTIFRMGIQRILERHTTFKILGGYSTGEEVLSALETLNPDVLITDISMEGVSGIDLIKQIHEKNSSVKLLALSMHPEDIYGIRAIKAGASAYLRKDCPEEQLVEAIHTLARGERYFTPRINDILLNELSKKDGEPHELLSDREFEVLILLGKGQTTNEIAHTLYLSPKTISTYKKRICEKLSLTNIAELINYVNKFNLV